ncbi:hypothetical protein [Rhodopirellula sp. P2]|uniref:hypothetical protein n=1 Tax=Rhodopirellula sp. P2 TaxID=2127060 RepID=UPI002368CF4D|nr:hypothetical protein [Rhodopirellula sp. P2]WDQ15109.1 hypothetical protein PSR62_15845 [Rhodopirellula sp. P2]
MPDLSETATGEFQPKPTPLSLVCPVCRATQGVSDQCRRCRADLSSINTLRRSEAFASLAALMNLVAGNQSDFKQSLRTLELLAPQKAKALHHLDQTMPTDD